VSNIIDTIKQSMWLSTKETLSNVIMIANRELDIELLSSRVGKPLANTRTVEMRGNTAIIPVIGTIVRYSSMFTDICGAVSTEILAKDFTEAMNNPIVKNIVFKFDTGGGEAKGIAELSDMIYEARNTKKIIAYVGDECASGGYWLASACSEIHGSKMAMVGSIGAVLTIRQSEEDNGIEIVSNVSPYKRPDFNTDEGLAVVQSHVDKFGEIFVDSVAINRGQSSQYILDNFGKGGIIVGQDAVNSGMLDSLTNFEDLLKKLD